MKFVNTIVLTSMLASFSAMAHAEQIVSAIGSTEDTVSWTLKAHAAKMNALENAMIACKSESVVRISEWKVQGPLVSGSKCIPESQEGPCHDTAILAITAAASFKCLIGPKPDLN